MDEKRPFIAVYMMTNKPRGTLYTGVTNSLYRRVYEHREGLIGGFTKRYGLKRLVWWEGHESMIGAIRREKAIKAYRREWKINLIERENPHWDDLYLALTQEPVWRHDPKP
ncbi:GIY-YIG nuclease family protein [Brevundimonas sp. 2R-24]|uniref:GIY-YIG nuclease family protein n=1 Tax=Peiella sedimenti TaxID=3061083 RepID=A0ABT8SJF9_9CAUL|nr:GIY-YIG nuclease family protein [Caulobacteraceae bacterium XZ-24]